MTFTTLTIESTPEGSAPLSKKEELIKTDRLGRIHVKPEHREALLDKFEQSGMSALQFAKLHGVKYTNFYSGSQTA